MVFWGYGNFQRKDKNMKKLLALLFIFGMQFSLLSAANKNKATSYPSIFLEPEGKLCINFEMDKAIAFQIVNNYSIAAHKDGLRHRLTQFYDDDRGLSLYSAQDELIDNRWYEITGNTRYSYIYFAQTKKLEYKIFDLFDKSKEKIITYTCGRIDME